jgi:NADH-quinone oxidoreductase subunit J
VSGAGWTIIGTVSLIRAYDWKLSLATEWTLGLATLLGAVGMWLMLPRGGRSGRRLGALLALVASVLLACEMPPLGDWAGAAVFYVLAAITIIAAAATVTFRSPVYCAIWFALSLLGTAGLFLFQGAQFLGVATIVVYAGAILVTFLFVLMLAQPEGDAFYDRISWEGLLASCAGALTVGLLTLTLVAVLQNPATGERPVAPFATDELERQILAPEHMTLLGGQLFSRYLIAVEVAGTLLLVALVGAVAIVGESAQSSHRPQDEPPLRLDPRSVAPRGAPEDEARRLAAARSHGEVLHG